METPQPRFRFARREFLLIVTAALLLLSVLAYNQFGVHGGAARVSIDGQVVLSVDLAREPDGMIALGGDYGVPASLEVKDGKIRFVDVDCPDHLCEKAGFIGADGQMAVCMPNRTAVVIVDP